METDVCKCICWGCRTADRHCGRVQDCGKEEFDYRVDTGMRNPRSLESRRKRHGETDA